MDLSSSTNKEFISSKEASLLTGYVSDYITRQCRLGKIKSEQRGRVWVIEKGSLLRYFAEEEKRKQENAQLLARAREEEYRQAQREREKREVVPSPYVPVALPFVWTEEGTRREVHGSSTALALTMMILSFGLYLGHEQVRAEVAAALHGVGEKTTALVEAGVHAALSLKHEDKPRASVAVTPPKHLVPEISLKPVFGFAKDIVARVPEFKKPSLDVSKEASADSRTANSVLEAGALIGKGLKNISNTILATYAHGVEKWVVVTPEIPPKIISFVGDIGYRIASVTNSTPTHVATSLGGLENTVLGVVGNIALAYDTTKENLVQAYHYAPGAKLAVVREAITKEQESKLVQALSPEERKPKLAEVAQKALGVLRVTSEVQVASAHASGAQSFFEGMALSTYKAIQGIFGGASKTVASLFVSKEKETAITSDTKGIGEQKAGEENAVVAKQEPESSVKETATPIYSGGNVYNQYTTVTATGVSKEYVEERIKLHLDNLDDRVDVRIESVESRGGGGGGGSGSVTSVDASGGTTGFSFSGGPITSSGTLTLSGFLNVASGGTGTSTAPSYGQVLLGNSLGGYDLVATSSLGIIGGAGTSFSTTSADYWETQQTARSADDLTNDSIENLLDVAVMTETFGDLLYWNGSSWTNVATSTLGFPSFSANNMWSGTNTFTGTTTHTYIANGSGSVGSPSYTFTGDTATGLYRLTGGRIGLSLSGVLGLDIRAGNFEVTSNISKATFNQGVTIGTAFTNTTPPSQGLLVNGITGIGTSSPYSKFSVWGSGTGAGQLFSLVNNASTTVMQVLDNGNVGIGTTSPYTKLSVSGGIRVGTNSGTDFGYQIIRDSNGTYGATNSLVFRAEQSGGAGYSFQTNSGTSLMQITNGGSIGISTTSPTEHLSIQGNQYTSGSAFFGGAVTATSTITWGSGSILGTAGQITSLSSGSFANGRVVLGTGLSNSTNGVLYSGSGRSLELVSDGIAGRGLIVETGTGKVGIGTTSPFAKLSVHANNGETNTTLFAIGSSTASATTTLLSVSNIGTVTIPTTANFVSGNAFFGADSVSIGAHKFYYRQNTGFTMSSDQRIGISSGTTNANSGPDTAFSRLSTGVMALGTGAVGNTIGTLALERIGLGTTTPYAQLSIVATSTNGLGAPTTLFAIASSSQGTATSTHLVVTNTGNVGIGSTSPSAKLSVVGTNTGNEVVTFINEGTGSGDEVLHLGVGAASAGTSNLFVAFYQGSSAAGMGTRIGYIQGSGANSVTYNTTSDRRLKDNIASTTLGLETLMNIGVHDFNFKNDPTHTTQGFIAQELYEVYPFAVARTDDGTGSLKKDEVPWGVDYGRITPLIVQAIQDIVNLSTPFKTNLIAWFADASNGIEEFFANRIKTTELCVKDEAGETCLTRAQLNELLAGVSGSAPDEEEGGRSEELPVEEPPAEETSTEEPPVEGVPAEEPPAEEAPEEVIPEESNTDEEAPSEEVASDTTI